MKSKMKYFIVLITLLFLTISVASASDNTTTHTNTETLEQTTHTVEKVATSTEAKKIHKINKTEKIKEETNMDDVYVSPDVTTAQEGTKNNPTTINDALTKIADNATIHLQKGSTGLYPITETLTISSSTIPTGITKLTIRGENVTLDGQKTTQIMNIESPINLNLENITLKNAKSMMGSVISTSTANLTFKNINCYNNSADYYIIYVDTPNGYFNIESNNFINNTATEEGGSGIFIMNSKNVTISGENLFEGNKASIGAALYVYNTNLIINGTNKFINNNATIMGGALQLQANTIISGTNTFINNSAPQGADILNYESSLKIEGNTNIINSHGDEGSSINHYGTSEGEISVSNITFKDINAKQSIISTGSEGSYVYENNTFINCSSNQYKAQANGKGSLLTFSGNIIFKNNKFFNCSTNQSILHPYTSPPSTEISNNTFENILSNETIIYSQRKYNTIVGNSFTNCNSKNETIMIQLLEFSGSNQQITDNTFINSTIKTNYTIELNENNPNPIRVQDKVNILIKDLVVANPDFYDSDVLEKTDICYEVYNNDELITTTENVKDNFNFTPTTTGEYQITTKSNLGSTSQNTLTFNVEEKLIETEIIAIAPTENPVNKSTPITIQLLDENGELVSNAKINMTSNGKTEEIELPLGITVIEYTPSTIGEETITFKFEGIGNNKPSEKELTIRVTEDKDQIIRELNQTVQEQDQTITELNQNITNITNELKDAKQEITEQQNKIKELNNTIQTKTKTINDLEQNLTEANNQIKTLNNQITGLNNQIKELTNENKQLENNMTKANNQIAEQDKQINDLNKALNDAQKAITTANNAIKTLNNTIKQLNDQIKQLTTPTETKITINTINAIKYAEDVKITGKLTDKTGNAIKNSAVTVNINGKTTNVATDNTGVYTYTGKQTNTGTNKVTVQYTANDKYKASQATSTFNVNKQNLKLTITNITSDAYKEDVTITGVFSDTTGKGISNTNINLTINTKTVKIKTTTGGIFKYTTKANKVGTNNVTVSYAGNKNYNKASTKKTFKVVKQDLIVTIDNLDPVRFKENITISGRFVDGNSKPIGNTRLTLSINGKNYAVKTDTQGRYKRSIRVTQINTNNVTVTYAGNSNYNKCTAKATFKAIKQNLGITLDSVKTSNSKITLSGTFTDEEGKPLMNSNVKVTINGKKYTAKTNNKGIYTLTKAYTGKNITLTLSYAGNKNYNSFTKTTKITV